MPEPDSLGQFLCQGEEREQLPFVFVPSESFFSLKKRLKSSPINNDTGAEGIEGTGRQWGKGMRCGGLHPKGNR